MTNLESQYKIHSLFAKRIDVVKYKCNDYVKTITFMTCNGILNDRSI